MNYFKQAKENSILKLQYKNLNGYDLYGQLKKMLKNEKTITNQIRKLKT
jgi:hypothetical protein